MNALKNVYINSCTENHDWNSWRKQINKSHTIHVEINIEMHTKNHKRMEIRMNIKSYITNQLTMHI